MVWGLLRFWSHSVVLKGAERRGVYFCHHYMAEEVAALAGDVNYLGSHTW